MELLFRVGARRGEETEGPFVEEVEVGSFESLVGFCTVGRTIWVGPESLSWLGSFTS